MYSPSAIWSRPSPASHHQSPLRCGEQFASLIQEKKGTISKVESNSLVPDDKLIKKIEKALGIKLTETVQSGAVVGSGGNGRNRTGYPGNADKIIKKIEKALGIKLTETVQSGVTVGPGGAGNKMTLANFIKKS